MIFVGIIITGGSEVKSDLIPVTDSVELYVPSTGFQCWLPNLPSPRARHSQNGPILCGGSDNLDPDNTHEDAIRSCVAFTSNGAWDRTLSYTDHTVGPQQLGNLLCTLPYKHNGGRRLL